MAKKLFVLIPCAVLATLLIVFNEDAAEAARSGFSLWQNVLLPELLPFFVCTSLIREFGAHCGAVPLFALSFVSGAPSGAKLCSEYYGAESDASVSMIAASLNMLSPVFIFGVFASSMLGAPSYALPLLIASFVSSLVCFLFTYRRPAAKPRQSAPTQNERGALASAISMSISALLSVCAAVIFFRVLAAMAEKTGVLHLLSYPLRQLAAALGGSGKLVEPIMLSMLEAASGASALAASGAPLRPTVAAAAFAFSFGGACIAAQSALFLKLRWGRYFLVKLISGLIAAAVAWLVSPLFQATAPVYAEASDALDRALSAACIFASSVFAMGLVMILAAVSSARARKSRTEKVLRGE